MKENLVNYTEKPNVEYSNSVRIISEENEKMLDSLYEEAMSVMNSNMTKIEDEKLKDELYDNVINIYNKMRNHMYSVDYTIELDKSTFRELSNVIKGQVEYDVNTLFAGINLANGVLSEWASEIDSNKEANKAKKEIALKARQTDITLIYHLLASLKVKGLTEQAYKLSIILTKIGEISKLMNYYDTLNKSINTYAIKNWLPTIEDMNKEQAEKMEQQLLNS